MKKSFRWAAPGRLHPPLSPPLPLQPLLRLSRLLRTLPRVALVSLVSRVALVAWLAVVAAVAACGGGGGGGSSPTSPPPPQTGITFTPSASGSGLSLAAGPGSLDTALNLQLRSSGIQDLYGVAFHLVYPYSVMHYTGATEGILLNGGGTVPTSFQVVEAPLGTLIVGLTRLGAVPGTSSAGTLVTLQFSAVATGTGNLSFNSNQAVASTGLPITSVAWSAGSVQSTVVAGSASTALRR